MAAGSCAQVLQAKDPRLSGRGLRDLPPATSSRLPEYLSQVHGLCCGKLPVFVVCYQPLSQARRRVAARRRAARPASRDVLAVYMRGRVGCRGGHLASATAAIICRPKSHREQSHRQLRQTVRKNPETLNPQLCCAQHSQDLILRASAMTAGQLLPAGQSRPCCSGRSKVTSASVIRPSKPATCAAHATSWRSVHSVTATAVPRPPQLAGLSPCSSAHKAVCAAVKSTHVTSKSQGR